MIRVQRIDHCVQYYSVLKHHLALKRVVAALQYPYYWSDPSSLLVATLVLPNEIDERHYLRRTITPDQDGFRDRALG